MLHFSRLGAYADADVPVIVRGEGSHVYDSRGKRYLDGLSSLFVTQIGHGREELSAAGAKQSDQLAYFPVWGYGHPSAIELSERLAERAPGDLNRVFLTTGGSECGRDRLQVGPAVLQADRPARALQGDQPPAATPLPAPSRSPTSRSSSARTCSAT